MKLRLNTSDVQPSLTTVWHRSIFSPTMPVLTGCDRFLWSPAEHLHDARRWFQAWGVGHIGRKQKLLQLSLQLAPGNSCVFVQGQVFSGYDIDLGTPLLLVFQSRGAMMQVPTGCRRLLWRHLQSTCTTQIRSRFGILAVGHIHQATAS